MVKRLEGEIVQMADAAEGECRPSNIQASISFTCLERETKSTLHIHMKLSYRCMNPPYPISPVYYDGLASDSSLAQWRVNPKCPAADPCHEVDPTPCAECAAAGHSDPVSNCLVSADRKSTR